MSDTNPMGRVFATLTNLFAVWIVLGTAWAFWAPAHFTWYQSYIEITLALVMLGMGLTLSPSDFAAVARAPLAVGMGVAAQFVIMPLLGWATASLFALPPAMAIGVILVGCCPGGTASNVVAYLSRAHLSLSVLMTMTSTLCSVVLTPLLTWWLAGKYVDVAAGAMLRSMALIVLLPILAGVAMNRLFPRAIRKVQLFSPLVSVLGVTMIVASIVAARRDDIIAYWQVLLAALFVFDSAGFALGYLTAKWLKQKEVICRTVSIEVGMQNSGLGAQLAREHFPSPLTPVPCAIAAVYHCLLGSLLASYWRARSPDEKIK